MAVFRRPPPDADNHNRGGGGTASSETSLNSGVRDGDSSETLRDSEGHDGDSAANSLLSPRGSSNPTGCPTVGSDDEGSASKSTALLLNQLARGQPTGGSVENCDTRPFVTVDVADDPNCAGGGSGFSETPRDSEDRDGDSAATSLLGPRCSSNPTGYPTFGTDNSSSSSYDEDTTRKSAALLLTHGSDQPTGSSVDNCGERSCGTDDPTVGAASYSALGYHDDEDPAARASDSLLPRSPHRYEYDEEDDSVDSWFCFSDLTGGAASTSTTSPDAYNFPSYRNAHRLVLESYFCGNEYEILQIPKKPSCKILEKASFACKAVELESQVMKDKINMLLADYPEYRHIFGDGNCFYRSFIYSYLEQLVEASTYEEMRLLGTIEEMWLNYQRFGYSASFPSLHDDFKQLILDCMNKKQTLSVSAYQDWLLQKCGNDQTSVNILRFLRLVAAIEMCSHADKYLPFLRDDDGFVWTVDGYCRMKVIPMQQEADHCMMHVLAQALEVPIRVVSIDSKPDNEPLIMMIWESPNSPSIVPTVTLFYRPGHYEILYPKIYVE